MRRPSALLTSLTLVVSACLADNGGAGDELALDDEQDAESGDEGDADTDEGSTGDGDDGGTDGGDDNGDGDGDGDGDGEPLADPDAQAACSIWEAGTVEEVQSVMTQADANQVVLTPSQLTAYRITLNEDPEGGYVGWVNMSIPDWGSLQAIFCESTVDYELFRSEGMDPISMDENLECPDAGITDQRIFFPHWADAQARFHTEDQAEIWFMFFKDE